MGSCTDFSYYDVTIQAAVEFGVGTFKAYKAVFFTMIDPMTRSTSPDYPKKITKKNRDILLTLHLSSPDLPSILQIFMTKNSKS